MAASDILRNNVKDKLARGEVVASMTVRLSRSIEIARIAKTAGFDMLYIDLEHSPLTMDATGQICMACLDIGIMPAVRVPANTPDYISRILDAGALGVIAPHVRSAAEARDVSGPRSCRRSANAPTPASSLTCNTVRFRRKRPARRSTTPPW